MTLPRLISADVFIGAKQYYSRGIVAILQGCVQAYKQFLQDGVKCDNNENEIRDVLVRDYLKKRAFKRKYKLGCFLFDSETVEGAGRADIRVFSLRRNFIDDTQYYLIECKRIDNIGVATVSGLNAKYIANGINRFVTGLYSCRFKKNGMIGFVVSRLDIDSNVQNINSLFGKGLRDDRNRTVLVQPEQVLKKSKGLIKGFDYVYTSLHKTSEGKMFKLYHLMFDLSNNIR